MSFCCQLAAMMPLMIFGGPDQIQAEVLREEPRRFVIIERPGRAPVIVGGSEEILARQDLKGIWQVVLLEHEGEPRPDLAADLQMKFSRGRLELMQRGRETIVVAYDLNLKYYPRHFHWHLRCDGRLYMQEGVFWVQGDTLMLCLGSVNGRPATEFLTQPGDGRTLYVLERVKPQEADQPVSGDQWMQLGVFALAKGDPSEANVLIRLAVDQEGTVVGQSYDLRTKSRQPLQGSVDKKTQRVVWTVGTDRTTVMETSLDSLTKDQSQVLVRHADGGQQTWTMTFVFAPSRPTTEK